MIHPQRPVGRHASTGTCPCGDRRPYVACCGPLHAGAPAPDAERLMRSRYCAYVLGDERYLLATWHPSTRPVRLDLDPGIKWLGLDVRRHVQDGPDAATVEFVARCRSGGRGQRMHETSRFVREDGRWQYIGGTLA